MALSIVELSSTPASIAISANMHCTDIYWYALKLSSAGYKLLSVEESPSAIYMDCGGSSFNWGELPILAPGPASSTIKVYKSDTVYILATTGSIPFGTILTSITGLPYIKWEPTLFYIEPLSVSKSEYNLQTTFDPPFSFTNEEMIWNIEPWSLRMSTSETLSSDGFIQVGDIGTLSGTASSIESINVSISSLNYEYETSHTVYVTARVDNYDITSFTTITYNAPLIITHSLDQTHTDMICATVFKNSFNLPSGDSISWSSTPEDNIFYELPSTPYTQHTIDYVSNIGTIKLSASSEEQLSTVYTFRVSSHTDNLSAISTFRPYLSYSSNTQLTSIVNNLYNENQYTVYDITLLGVTNGLKHNIEPNYPIYYDYNYFNLKILNYDDIRFNPEVNVAMPASFDRIIIKIENNEVDNIGDLPGVSTYNIVASALSGNDLESDSFLNHIITLTGWNYPSASLFDLILKIDSNPSTNLKYIELPTSPHTYSLSVDLSTVLLPDDTSGECAFYKDGVLISAASLFSDKDDLLTKSVNFFQGSIYTYTVDEYTLSVSANYNDCTPTVKNYSTLIKYVSVDHIDEDDIMVYPQYLWSPSAGWAPRVDYSSFTIYPENDGILYGNGRSENILLSTPYLDNVILYKWTIYDASNDNIISTIESIDNKIWTTIKTGCSGDYAINVKLGVYNDGNIDMSEQDISTNIATKLSALVFNEINYTLENHVIQTSDNIPVPGSITATLSSPPTDNQYPINVSINSLIVELSTSYWIYKENISVDRYFNFLLKLSLSDTGSNVLSVPKFENTVINLNATPIFRFNYISGHPYDDWCDSELQFLTGSEVNKLLTACPVEPYYYIPNKYVLTGNSSFYNLVPENDLVNYFEWTSLSLTSISGFDVYIVNYDLPGTYGLYITTNYCDDEELYTEDDYAINVLDQYPLFDPDITRKVNDPISLLPYKCGIGANEWLINDTINLSFKKIYDNLEHLIDQSRLYVDPPTQYLGWLGSIDMADNSTRFRWFTVGPGTNYSLNNPSIATDDKFNNLQDCIARNNIIYATDYNEDQNTSVLYILSSDFHATQMAAASLKSIGVEFSKLKTIQLDSEDESKIYLLNTSGPDEILVYKYKNDTWDLLYDWGGLGSATSKYKFKNPQDICLGENLWVADTDNYAVKKYTKTGNWIDTYILNNKPISICLDSNNRLQILCDNNIVFVYDTNGVLKLSYSLDIIDTYTKIRSCVDGGFVYISGNAHVIKSNLDGTIQLTLNTSNFSDSYSFDNRGLNHDEHRNLYVCQKNHILKFNDQIKLIYLLKEEILDDLWTLEDIYINKHEYVQDWVINKSLNRLWDNIEAIRRSIKGKLSYEKIIVPVSSENETPIIPPDDLDTCQFDWYPDYSFTKEQITYNCHTIPSIRPFIDSEYIMPIHDKADVLIGINEFVTADVINRVLCQLQDNLLSISEMLSLSRDKSSESCNMEDVETDTTNLYESLSECYPDFYKQYPCQYAIFVNGPTSPCVGQAVTYKAGALFKPGCENNIKQIIWSLNGTNVSVTNYENANTFNYVFSSSTINILQTLTVTLSVEIDSGYTTYSKSMYIRPLFCAESTLTGPLIACTGEAVVFNATVNSPYVSVSGYEWTLNGSPIRNINTNQLSDHLTFNIPYGLNTIVMEPRFVDLDVTPSDLIKTSYCSGAYCPVDIINENTHIYFISPS